MNSGFQLPIRVYYEDTDLTGVVYHANILKFFERARTEWLRAIDQAHSQLAQQGILFAVYRAEIDYCQAIRMHDKIIATCTKENSSRARITFHQTIIDAHRPQHCFAKGLIQVVCLNPQFSPRAFPAEILGA